MLYQVALFIDGQRLGIPSGITIFTCCNARDLWMWYATDDALGGSQLNWVFRALYPWMKISVAGAVLDGTGGGTMISGLLVGGSPAIV